MTSSEDIGQTWADQWGQMVERFAAFGDDGRLQRGEDYAQKGNVTDISVSIASVFAYVAGGQPTPYEVSVQIRPIPAAQWHMIFTHLVHDAELVDQIASGQLPPGTEELFLQFGSGLLPTADELDCACDCPDWASPCKHSYAVLMEVRRLIRENPLHLLMLRGLPQAIWLERTQQAAAQSRALGPQRSPSAAHVDNAAGDSATTTPPSAEANWNAHAKWIHPGLDALPWETHPQTGKPMSPAQALWFAAKAGESAFWYGPAPVVSSREVLQSWDPLMPTHVDDVRAGYAVYKWGRPPFPLPGPDAMTTLRDVYRRTSESAAELIEDELGIRPLGHSDTSSPNGLPTS